MMVVTFFINCENREFNYASIIIIMLLFSIKAVWRMLLKCSWLAMGTLFFNFQIHICNILSIWHVIFWSCSSPFPLPLSFTPPPYLTKFMLFLSLLRCLKSWLWLLNVIGNCASFKSTLYKKVIGSYE